MPERRFWFFRTTIQAFCLVIEKGAVDYCVYYDTDWIIGKTSSEIIDQYGAFDCITMDANEDGLYKNCKCGYTIIEEKQGFLPLYFPCSVIPSSDFFLLFVLLASSACAILKVSLSTIAG